MIHSFSTFLATKKPKSIFRHKESFHKIQLNNPLAGLKVWKKNVLKPKVSSLLTCWRSEVRILSKTIP